MKRVIIVHRWAGSPSDDWYPWLKKELESRGFSVVVPQMPDTDKPHIDKWIDHLRKIVGKLDENTYFVGHSVGCQAIIRYLETVPGKVGGIVLVAGWLGLRNLETEEEKEIAYSWENEPINFERTKEKTKKIVAIFSDDDPWVPVKDAELFKNKLGAKIIIRHKMQHFTEKSLPFLLEEIIKITS